MADCQQLCTASKWLECFLAKDESGGNSTDSWVSLAVSRKTGLLRVGIDS